MQNRCDSMYSKQTGSECVAIAPLHESYFRAGKIVIVSEKNVSHFLKLVDIIFGVCGGVIL